jgi:hypothetical protein
MEKILKDSNDSEVTEIGLFREKFFTDWVVILGLVTAAMGAFSATRSYGNARDFVTNDWVALTIDATISAGANLLIFGFVPAIFRRRSLRASGAKSEPGEYMPSWKFLLLALAICPLVVVISANENEAAMSNGATVNRCVPKGVDELCIEGKYLGANKMSLQSTWKYASQKAVAGYLVSEISWMSKVDCEAQSGYVEYLDAYDSFGGRVNLPDSIRNQMIEGIQSDQMVPLTAQVCAEK